MLRMKVTKVTLTLTAGVYYYLGKVSWLPRYVCGRIWERAGDVRGIDNNNNNNNVCSFRVVQR